MIKFFGILPIVCLLLVSCGWLRDPGTPVAKVKDHTLTLEELKSNGETRRDSMIKRVQTWVNDEVLYQEALSAGIQNEQDVAWLLHDAEKKIILDAYQRRFRKKLADPEEGELEAYFDAHRPDFVRNESQLLYRTWFYESLQAAKDAYHASPENANASVDSIVWVPSSQTGVCVGAILATLQPQGVSIPQVCDGKFLILKLYARKSIGEPLSFREARSGVLVTVREERKAQALDSLLQEAKSRQAVFTWPENLPKP